MWNRMVAGMLRAYVQLQVRRRAPRPFGPADMERVQRILLITTTAIGDTMFSTPAIRAMKETYPEKEVHVLCHWRNRLLLRDNPYVDRLLYYRGKAKLLSLMQALKEPGYDLVVILHGNDPEAVPLACATGAPYRIGSGTSDFAFALSRGITCTEDGRHAIERRLDLVRAAGAETEKKGMDLFLPADWETRADRILEAHFQEAPRPLVGFHPTGSGKYKWWPAEHFASLGERLNEAYGSRFVIISSREEASVVRRIGSRLRGRAMLIEGRLDLLEVACLVKKCGLFIANDSGPLHMALALGVPTVALIGADSPLRIGPYGVPNALAVYRKEEVCHEARCRNQKCADNRCLKVISPEEVWEKIKLLKIRW